MPGVAGDGEVIVSRLPENVPQRHDPLGAWSRASQWRRSAHLAEVHEQARRIAGGLAAAGVGLGDAVGVLAGAPVEIAPTAQGLWMRGASPPCCISPRPHGSRGVGQDTATVIDMIEAKAIVISEPFLVAAPILEQRGLKVLTVESLLAAEPVDPVETSEDDVALMQLTSGSTGSPKAVIITHRNIYSNAEAMFIGAEYEVDKDVMVSWLPCFTTWARVGFDHSDVLRRRGW